MPDISAGKGGVVRFRVYCATLGVVALTGGSFSATMPSLLVLRPVTIVGVAILLLTPGGWDWRQLRVPAALLACFALVIAAQLVPLPLSWWQAMPGHDRYAAAAAISDTSVRPISLSPDLTLNSLLALLPAAATIIGYAGLDEERRRLTLWLFLALSAASAATGLIELATGLNLSPYGEARDVNVLAGFLTNRNHEAVLLAVTMPALAVAARLLVTGRHAGWAMPALLASLVLAVPLILLTGSRQGTVLGAAALAYAVAAWPRSGGWSTRRGWLVPAGAMAAVLALVAASRHAGRAFSLDRLSSLQASEDVRWRAWPTIWRMTKDFFPFGTGFGTFNPVFQGYEPDGLLNPSYLNNAHNDVIETVLTGGLAGVVLLLAFAGWAGWRLFAAVQARGGASHFARAASAMVGIIGAASLVDYPLRTGLMSVVMTLACCWLAAPPGELPAAGHRRRQRRVQ